MASTRNDWRGIGFAALAGIAMATGAHAEDAPALFADAEASLFASAVALPTGAAPWRVAPRPTVLTAACAAPANAGVRLAVVTAAPTRRERELCQAALGAAITSMAIGREAAIVVAHESAPALSLTADCDSPPATG